MDKADKMRVIARARELARQPEPNVRELKGVVKGLLNVIDDMQSAIKAHLESI